MCWFIEKGRLSCLWKRMFGSLLIKFKKEKSFRKGIKVIAKQVERNDEYYAKKRLKE